MKRLILVLALLLAHTPARAQDSVARPTTFRIGIRLFPTVRPSSPDEGSVYQDESTHKLYVYDGSQWVELGAATTSVSALTGSVTMDGAHGTAGQVLTSGASGATTWADVSGSGVPGGAAGAVQYKNGGNFGGTALTYNGTKFSASYNSIYAGAWLQNSGQATAESPESFEFMIGSASNDTGPGDTRPDLVASIGWNASGAQTGHLPNFTGVGSSQLSFETYCSYGTGCLGGGGGQSETYFAMSDGNGHDVRPLGFFQGKFQDPDHAGELSVIARANQWGFFDTPQNHNFFSIDSNEATTGIGTIRFFDSVANFNFTVPADSYYTFLVANGNNVLSISDTYGIEIGRGAGVALGVGGDGSAPVILGSNHVRVLQGTFEDGDGGARFSMGSGAQDYHPSIGSQGGGEIIMKSLGNTTSVKMTIQGGATGGDVSLQPQGAGRIQLQAHLASAGSTPSVASTTSNSCGTTSPSISGTDTVGRITVGATSGTSCTVTFANAYVSNVPACMAMNETTAGVVKAAPTTGVVVLSGTFTAGDKISYHCMEW